MGGTEGRLIGLEWSKIRHFIQSNRIEPTDSGIFDPFIPLGSLKKIDREYQADYGLTENRAAFEPNDEPKRSFFVLHSLAFLIAVIFAFRLVSLQITQGQDNFQLAEGNRLRTTYQEAPRGLIYDSRGNVLVQNSPNFSLVIHPGEIPKKADDRNAYLNELAASSGIERTKLEQLLSENDQKKNRKSVLTIADNINRDQSLSLEIKTRSLPGVDLVKQPVRIYGSLPSLGNLLGYIGRITEDEQKSRPNLLPTAFVGKTGVEYSYDEVLQGTPGQEIVEIDSRGRTERLIGNKPARSGHSLILGLDSETQRVAAEALAVSISKSEAKNGAAVMLDVNTGDVLAMVSLPTFDNNLFAPTTDSAARQNALSDPSSPLINRAISGQYPSGSTVKPFIATAGLSTGVISASTKLDTSVGKIEIGQWTFHDWKTHGITDVKQAIAESNNIFFYSVGGGYKQITGLGADRLSQWLQKFGFGQLTGIDIPGEQDGLVPTPDWKKKTKKESWYIGDTYNLSIGQGDFLVTPLQLTRATAAIANGGRLVTPRLVKSSFSTGNGQRDYPAKSSRDSIATDSILQTVRDGMRQSVTSGSARSLNSLSIQVAAKTGTAQFDLAKEKTHSWFTAFAPYDHPQIAVSVIIEGGGEGFAVAAPVAKNMIEQYFRLPLSSIQPPLND